MDLDIAIVGAGFAGLCMGIRLKQAGHRRFTIFEQEDGVGGTWRVNRYPGAACDVPSHLYSFSFAPNPRWSWMYGRQREILAYLEDCADRFDLRPHLRLRTAVTGAAWDEADGRWVLSLSDGTTARAHVFVNGTGFLSQPQVPDIPGLADFDGPTFHSARWDPEVDLAGRRVAVIGTGASAIQVVPAIAPEVARLHVFQRTPPWIRPRPDRSIGPREQRLYAAVPALQQLYRTWLYWKLEAAALGFTRYPSVLRFAERFSRRHLERAVPDRELREKLLPDYAMGCKRILVSSDWYPAVQRDNVEVVTERIETITSHGIRTADGEREVDAIVLCTGFRATDSPMPFPVVGREGLTLEEAWSEGIEGYLGTTVAGFPNLFFLVGPNTGLGHNSMVFVIESQVRYVLSALETLARSRTVEVRREVQDAFNEEVHRRMEGTVWMTGCRSWYQDRRGRITTLWPGTTVELRARTRRFRPGDYRLG